MLRNKATLAVIVCVRTIISTVMPTWLIVQKTEKKKAEGGPILNPEFTAGKIAQYSLRLSARHKAGTQQTHYWLTSAG